MAQMSMADLLAGQEKKQLHIERGQNLKGQVISILPQEIIFDLGSKAEGVLYKKDLTSDTVDKIKVGQRMEVFVAQSENESGQVVLSLYLRQGKQPANIAKWNKFLDGLRSGQAFNIKGVELNKGGLVVEAGGLRGFLPTSQMVLTSSAADDLVGKSFSAKVVEADPLQNKLIFAQVIKLSDQAKEALSNLKPEQEVDGEISKVLPFGILVKLENDLEGLIHVSELSWERVEDPSTLYQEGDKVKAQVLSVDNETGKIALSLKVLQQDPFEELAQKYQPDDVVKGTVTRLSDNGVYFDLGGVEALLPGEAKEAGKSYEVGQSMSLLIDKVDPRRRQVLVSPFLTSTSGLIYK